MLYPAHQQQELRQAIVAAGNPARYVEIDSPHGHDAFLIEVDQVGLELAAFLAEVEKDHA